MKFYSFDLDVNPPMTLVLKLELDIIKMYVCTEMKFLPTAVQKSEHTHTHTYTQTHGQIEIITYHIYADGNRVAL